MCVFYALHFLCLFYSKRLEYMLTIATLIGFVVENASSSECFTVNRI